MLGDWDVESLRCRWRPGSVIDTPRRGMVDRRTATLMYAGRLLAGRRPDEARAQPQLRGPGPGHHLGIQALLALAQLDPGRRAVLVVPGRLDHLGAQVG